MQPTQKAARLIAALLAQAVSIFGGLRAKALAPGLAAKPPVLVIAKAGKVAVGVGCQHHTQRSYSWRAPVAGLSSSNGKRGGAVCALVPFAIRLVGARWDLKGSRLNCSDVRSAYAVFVLYYR